MALRVLTRAASGKHTPVHVWVVRTLTWYSLLSCLRFLKKEP